MLNVTVKCIMPSVIMLNIVMLNVTVKYFIKLSVVMQIVVKAECHSKVYYAECCFAECRDDH
jgi:hypothetical protein